MNAGFCRVLTKQPFATPFLQYNGWAGGGFDTPFTLQRIYFYRPKNADIFISETYSSLKGLSHKLGHVYVGRKNIFVFGSF
jgi:hypothetical protein